MNRERGKFPVLKQSTKATMPRTVPWEFVDSFREQAELNHGQTLERLAERGGLCPEELYAAAHGFGLRVIRDIDEKTAIEWLYDASGEPRQ